jgi:hypothetical protein
MGNRKRKDKKKALKHRFASNRPQSNAPSVLLIDNPPGEVKMSEVLMDFIAPYHSFGKTLDQMRKVLAVALVAWNAAIGPDGEDLVRRTVENLPPDAQDDFLTILEAMIERKQRYFADNNRIILNYNLTPLPDGSPYLSVMSTFSR